MLVRQAQPVKSELLAQKATLVLKDRQAPLVRREKSESKERKVQLVRKDQKVKPGYKD